MNVQGEECFEQRRRQVAKPKGNTNGLENEDTSVREQSQCREMKGKIREVKAWGPEHRSHRSVWRHIYII